MGMPRQPPQHYRDVNALDEWKRGPWGWLIRLQGICLTAGIHLVGGFFAWIFTTWMGALAVLLVGFTVVSFLVYYRRITVSRIESDRSLHTLIHCARDDIGSIIACRGAQEVLTALRIFENRVAEGAAAFFRARRNDNTICCAIRKATFPKEGASVYTTTARSNGLSPSREANTESLRADEGLPKAFLRDHGGQGVIIIPDRREAERIGWWKWTRNDGLPDVNTVMVCPINGPISDNNRDMFGLLYVTSSRKWPNVFRPCDTPSLSTIADYLGLVYYLTTPRIIEITSTGTSDKSND